MGGALGKIQEANKEKPKKEGKGIREGEGVWRGIFPVARWYGGPWVAVGGSGTLVLVTCPVNSATIVASGTRYLGLNQLQVRLVD